MMHARTEIRDKFIELLDGSPSALGGAGSPHVTPSIFGSRIIPLDVSLHYPVVMVYTSTEEVDLDAGVQGKNLSTRNLTITVEIRVAAEVGLDDELDDIAARVEKIIYTSNNLGKTVLNIELTSTETELIDDAEQMLGRATMIFECMYMVNPQRPHRTLKK